MLSASYFFEAPKNFLHYLHLSLGHRRTLIHQRFNTHRREQDDHGRRYLYKLMRYN